MPNGVTHTFADAFNTNGVFTGNNGTLNFLTSWTENNDDANAAAGDIRIANNRLEFGGAGLTVEANDSIQRSATVTGATSLELTYSWAPLSGNFTDNFNTNGSFTGNNGTANFLTNWTENNDDANAAAGDIRIANNRIEFGGAGLTVEANDSIQRSATVTGSTSLTLQYSWNSAGLETDGTDEMVVEYSTDGVAWTVLRTLDGDPAGSYTDTIPWTPTNNTAFVLYGLPGVAVTAGRVLPTTVGLPTFSVTLTEVTNVYPPTVVERYRKQGVPPGLAMPLSTRTTSGRSTTRSLSTAASSRSTRHASRPPSRSTASSARPSGTRSSRPSSSRRPASSTSSTTRRRACSRPPRSRRTSSRAPTRRSPCTGRSSSSTRRTPGRSTPW